MATCKDFDDGSDQITQLCNFCDKNISDGYCNDCAAYMCKSCFDVHIKGRTCRNHVLLDDSCENDNKKINTEPCKRHPNQIIKFYCVHHQMVGCVECFFPDHRNCHYKNIVDAAKAFQDNGEDTRLKRELRQLEDKHSKCTDQCELDKETAVVINNKTVEDVKSFKDTVTSYVAKVEEVALERAEKLRMENETRLEKRLSELDTVGEDIELCTIKLENQDTVDQLFIAAVEMKSNVELLGQKMTSLGCQSVVTKYDFQPNKLITEMMQESRSFGDVCILLEETETSQHGDDNDSSDLELSERLEEIPPPTQAMIESISSFPGGKHNAFKEEAKTRSEKEYGNVPAEINPEGSFSEKKRTIQLKPVRDGKFYLIKSDACCRPFKYTPKYGEVSIDEKDDLLYDGDQCFSILIRDGLIVLDCAELMTIDS